MSRPPLTRETWLELDKVIRATDGYEVVESLGERPGGPSKTKRFTWPALDRSRNVKQVPPTIKVRCPDGTVRNVGSIDRWIALRRQTKRRKHG